MPYIKCEQCGKNFYIIPSRVGKAKFCSIACKSEYQKNGDIIFCRNCNKEIYRTKYRQNLRNNQFCSIKCEKEYQHSEAFELRKCEICGNSFECSKISTQRFCSNKCNSEWQKTQIGELNPKYLRLDRVCCYCGNPIKIKSYKKDYENVFCDNECRQKWYSEIFSQTPEWKESRKINAVKILESGAISTINTKPQQIVDNILVENNIKNEREKNVIYYSVDNFINDKYMIEVQGDYWHCSPLIYKEQISEMQYKRIINDKRKRAYIYNNYGINVLYLWESDILNNPQLCSRLIKLYIENDGILINYNSFNYSLNDNNEIFLNHNIILPYFEMETDQFKHLLKKVS